MHESLTVIAHIRAKPGHESRVREILQGLLSPTRAEAGCINYDLHQSHTDPALFVFYENWVSEAHLEAHSKSPHIQSLRKVAGEVLAGPVEITKWQVVI
ncbi:MAG TPA: putative quinol monooxygenase [Candidatus Acidoferrales bacterium]|nr:putative quinol monooxygenase [Candidatus Acidoferrales bacterium]